VYITFDTFYYIHITCSKIGSC